MFYRELGGSLWMFRRNLTCSIGPTISFSVLTKGAGMYGALGQGNSLKDLDNFEKVVLEDVNKIAANDEVRCLSTGWGHSAVVSKSGLFIFGRPYDFSNLMQL